MRLAGCGVAVKCLGTLGEAGGEVGDVESRVALQTAPPRATSARHVSRLTAVNVASVLTVPCRTGGRGRMGWVGRRSCSPGSCHPTACQSHRPTNHPADHVGSQRGEVGEVGQCRGDGAAEPVVAQIHLLQTQHVAQLGRLDPIPPTCLLRGACECSGADVYTCLSVYVSTCASVHV